MEAKKFEEYLAEKIVKKITPDRSRAKFLIQESENSKNFLDRLLKIENLNAENANSIIKISYDILMELLRADMLLNGFNASGHHAHEAEVAYMRIMGFNENEVIFADQLRYLRNRIMYYGTLYDEEYAQKVVKFVKDIYPKLKKILAS